MANYYKKEHLSTNASPNTYLALRSTALNTIVAQRFTLSETVTTPFLSLMLYLNGSPVGNIWIKIYSSGDNPTSGTLLYTSANVSTSELTTAVRDIPFTFGSNLTLTAGVYYVVLEGDYPISGAGSVLYRRTNTSTYANGEEWVFDGTAWNSNTGDMRLVVYSFADGGHFDIDTDTNVAGLIALKGGNALSATDQISIFNGARLTCEQSFSILKIYLGQSSIGAATNGNKFGKVTFRAGITCTFGGHVTAANSGIWVNPTSADTSSKQCEVIVEGTADNPVTFTNAVGANNINNKWTFIVDYGIINMVFPRFLYSYASIFTRIPANSSYSGLTCIATDAYVGPPPTALVVIYFGGGVVDTPMDFRRWTFDDEAFNLTFVSVAINTQSYADGFSMDLSGFKLLNSKNAYFTPFQGATRQTHAGTMKLSYSDIRPTVTKPTSITAADAGTGKALQIAISNIASYSDTDFFEVRTQAGTMVARFTKARYVAQGNVGYTTPVLTNGTAYQLQVRASSDNNTFSDWSELSNAATPAPGGGGISKSRLIGGI